MLVWCPERSNTLGVQPSGFCVLVTVCFYLGIANRCEDWFAMTSFFWLVKKLAQACEDQQAAEEFF